MPITVAPLKLIRRGSRHPIVLLAVVVAGAVGLWVLAIAVGDRAVTLAGVEAEIRSWGIWGPVISMMLAIAHAFVPFPLEALAVANGMLFGFGRGFALTWAGSLIGALLSWALARLAGGFVRRRLLDPRRRMLVDEWNARHGARTLLAVRFVPAISFSLVNYLAGLAGVRLWPFLWTTAIGMLPVTSLVVGIGAGVVGQVGRGAMITATAALAVLPFLPVLWRRGGHWYRRRQAKAGVRASYRRR